MRRDQSERPTVTKPRVESLEGRALLAASPLRPEMRPLSFLVGEWTGVTRNVDGSSVRVRIGIAQSDEGRIDAYRLDAPPGQVKRLWTYYFNEATNRVEEDRTLADGTTFHAVVKPSGPRTLIIDGITTRPDGSTVRERNISRDLGPRRMSFAVQQFAGGAYRTVEFGLRRRI